MTAVWETAVQRADLQQIHLLLAEGAPVDARDHHGQTALMLAAHAGHRELVETLLSHRADLNVTAKYGLNALMLAIIAGHTEIAQLLADAGTDLSTQGTGAPGFAGKTACDLAAGRGMNLEQCSH